MLETAAVDTRSAGLYSLYANQTAHKETLHYRGEGVRPAPLCNLCHFPRLQLFNGFSHLCVPGDVIRFRLTDRQTDGAAARVQTSPYFACKNHINTSFLLSFIVSKPSCQVFSPNTVVF